MIPFYYYKGKNKGKNKIFAEKVSVKGIKLSINSLAKKIKSYIQIRASLV
jgi:hypothetical protein